MDVFHMNPLTFLVIAINAIPVVGMAGAVVYTVYWALFDRKGDSADNDPYWSVCDVAKQDTSAGSVIFMRKAEALLVKLGKKPDADALAKAEEGQATAVHPVPIKYEAVDFMKPSMSGGPIANPLHVPLLDEC